MLLRDVLNIGEVEPGATKLAPVGIAPKHAEQPIEKAVRLVDALRTAIWTGERHF